MSVRDQPDGRIIAQDLEGIEAALSHMEFSLQDLAPGESLLDYVARGPSVIREHVEAILAAISGSDAFDVIETMRVHEMPMALEGYRESIASGRPATIDLIATVLLARGPRSTEDNHAASSRAALPVSQLQTRAGALLALGQYTLLTDGLAEKYGPLTALAATFVGHDINVKVRQYLHVARRVDEELFSSAHVGTLLIESLGFDYEDFVAVREAIPALLNRRFVDQAERLASVVEEWHSSGRPTRADRRAEEGRQALEAMIIRPSRRTAFRATEIAEVAGISVERVTRVLDRFSVRMTTPSDPVVAVQAFLAGSTPFRHASLLEDGSGNYSMLNVPIGTDCFRQVVEQELKASPALWKRYERRRAVVSEQLAVEHLTRALGTTPAYINLKYLRPNAGVAVTKLGRDARDLTAISEQTEADALFIIEDVAICVEVKARSFSVQARGGSVKRLSADLRATVTDATKQALRLETLIRENHGLWLEDRTWLDLSAVREVRSIAVSLDDLGPLGVALDELVRAGVITSERFPWITSLHDLAVIAEIIDRPAELLLYLRRRTESEVSLKFSAVDELDLFMLFLEGHLYVEPDLDRVSEEFLGVRRASRSDRQRHLSSAVPTRVMTHTDDLDAWLYYEHGESQLRAPKPTFASDAHLLSLVDFLLDGKKPGWFRFAADLLNLAGDAQSKVVRGIHDVAEQTRRDGRGHTNFMAFAGAWGYPTLFIGTRPPSMSHATASNRLALYALAKKHQIKSDRALVVLVDERGAFRSVRYVNTATATDEQLDALIARLGLQAPEAMARPIPPSARRATKRLNPKKKPKRR